MVLTALVGTITTGTETGINCEPRPTWTKRSWFSRAAVK
jgi:hypothetical protein